MAVVQAAESAACGNALTNAGDILFDWADPRFSMERDALVALDELDTLVAYGYAFGNDPSDVIHLYCALNPTLDAEGLDTHLAGRLLARAQEQAAEAGLDPAAVTVGVSCLRGDVRRRELYERLGFEHQRVFQRLVIDASDLPGQPPWPEGIEVREFRHEDDAADLHAVIQDAFRDHYHATPIPYDVWAAQVFGDEDFDPGLVFVAREGDDAVGAVVALPIPEFGYVEHLAVRRAWRGRGLGTALLLHAFHRLAARGHGLLGLDVDAESATGAAELYRHVGLQAWRTTDFFTRRLGRGDGAS